MKSKLNTEHRNRVRRYNRALHRYICLLLRDQGSDALSEETIIARLRLERFVEENLK